MTTKKAAVYLGISTSTLYRMLEKGVLTPAKTPGGQRRFNVEELEKYKESSRNINSPHNPSGKIKEIATKIIEKSMATMENAAAEFKTEKEQKPIDKRNTLNDLNGTQWLPETKSFFYQKGLGANHPDAQIERLHPAPFSYQDIQHLIAFFTKKDMEVLDPFGGIGSTAKACELLNRKCTSIELQKKFHKLSIKRLDTEIFKGAAGKHNFINGDARKILKSFINSSFDFIVTSPPYWGILNKKADYKVLKERVAHDLSTRYSDDANDLANIPSYDEFLNILVNEIFMECMRVLKPKKYMCLIVSDFRNKSEYISFHSDLIQGLNKRITKDNYKVSLQGTKILLQNHKSLLPYGYPFAYVENIHHQYVLIFRKDKK